MTALLRYDAACMAIAEAKTVDEVSDWIDKAAAVREYGRRIKNRQMEIDAIEIRVRAKKRRGELVVDLKSKGMIREGRREKLSSEDDSLPRYTLADLGVSPNESSEEQKIARIDGSSFERLLARCRAYVETHPERHAFDVLKPPPDGPINGARAIMGSRVEDIDSLDYFPTPPWATRALVERVIPRFGMQASFPRQSAWEPACGEGHIAEVLSEYFGEVVATDIRGYGYGAVSDFLTDDPPFGFQADWIVTNPPFGEKAEAFVVKAIERARVGVAMFLRLQWLETIGRYENIFQPFPPAVIGQFAERVPLCKGRWEPTGSTATAYLWIVWLKSRKGATEFFWIPPGCRDGLSRPDDVERFTANPVTKAKRPAIDASGIAIEHDPATGEVLNDDKPGAEPPEDDLEIPAFLRRAPAEARA